VSPSSKSCAIPRWRGSHQRSKAFDCVSIRLRVALIIIALADVARVAMRVFVCGYLRVLLRIWL
jgi:hypothetical protein